MTKVNFTDFTQAQLKNIVQDHNLHLIIKKYSKLTKSELIKLIETMLFIDSNNRIKIIPEILSKYNEFFKDITPRSMIIKKAPKEQPKPKTPEPIAEKEISPNPAELEKKIIMVYKLLKKYPEIETKVYKFAQFEINGDYVGGLTKKEEKIYLKKDDPALVLGGLRDRSLKPLEEKLKKEYPDVNFSNNDIYKALLMKYGKLDNMSPFAEFHYDHYEKYDKIFKEIDEKPLLLPYKKKILKA
jgi:hypothetical protein